MSALRSCSVVVRDRLVVANGPGRGGMGSDGFPQPEVRGWDGIDRFPPNSWRFIRSPRRRAKGATTDIRVCGLQGRTMPRTDAVSTGTRTILLDRWTWHGAVGTEYAAIARLWFEAFTTALTIIKKLAGVVRHPFGRLVPTTRTGDCGDSDHADFHSEYSAPAPAT